MKFGVVVFPGSNCDDDMKHVLSEVMGQEVVSIWHKENSLPAFDMGDCVVLPGGFSYGDYLRAGAIARFSPVMKPIIEFARAGGLVLGICNGFQILCEAGLLPGVLLRNIGRKFICKNVYLKVITTRSLFTSRCTEGQVLKIPIAHAEGRYFTDSNTLTDLEKNDQILFKYCDALGELSVGSNVNGSTSHIAGICNLQRNVFGMMPHPERASEKILGNNDGKILFESLIHSKILEVSH